MPAARRKGPPAPHTSPPAGEVPPKGGEGGRTLRIHPDGSLTYQGGSSPALEVPCAEETPTSPAGQGTCVLGAKAPYEEEDFA